MKTKLKKVKEAAQAAKEAAEALEQKSYKVSQVSLSSRLPPRSFSFLMRSPKGLARLVNKARG